MASGGNQAKEPQNLPHHIRQSSRQPQKDNTTHSKANHSKTHDLTSAMQQTSRPVGDPGSLVEIRPPLGPSDEYSEGPQPRKEEYHKDNLATHSRAKPRPQGPEREEHLSDGASPATKTASSSQRKQEEDTTPNKVPGFEDDYED